MADETELEQANANEEQRKTQIYLLRLIRQDDSWAVKQAAAEMFGLISGSVHSIERKS